jgi:nitroreductase
VTDAAATDGGVTPGVDLDRFEALVEARRTNLRMDLDRPVPDELVERLCRMAMWAPNHKKTWPWRFATFVGDARSRLGNTIADALDPATFDKPQKIEKYRTKYLRAPMMLAVGSVAGGSEIRDVENREAVAAGVQNLLLGATAAGLASFWASIVPDADPAVAELCGWEPGTHTVAVIYLGWPIGDVPVPERPSPEIARLTD